MRAFLIVALILLGMQGSAVAGEQVQAREVARINNCLPKKIEVYENSLGLAGKTVYRVQCNMPKATGETSAQADTLLIACDAGVCDLLRPMQGEKK